ncbi:DUF6286 domain-containing protein [Amycolatopsis sp. NPDC059021]|uniref:DUF6286 domain-containing protein n=1 Tax=Amycolatopsis sp. NPDC059021 TaxID=3346704 RepID=UPI00366DE798
MIRRPRRGLPASLLALVLLAACVLIVVALVQRLVGERPFLSYDAIAERVHATTWHTLPVLVWGGVAVLAGLVLLVLAVVPGRPTVVPLTEEAGFDSGITRRGVLVSLRGAANSVDGVTAARIRLGRKKVVAHVRTSRDNTDGLADAVRVTLARRIEEIGPENPPEVRVRVRAVTTRGVR